MYVLVDILVIGMLAVADILVLIGMQCLADCRTLVVIGI